MLDLNTFILQLSTVKDAASISGTASYRIKEMKYPKLTAIRNNTSSTITIKLDELYQVYLHLSFINTSNVKSYITGQVYSPAIAILIASSLYDDQGFRKNTKLASKAHNLAVSVNKIQSDVVEKNQKKGQDKDEKIFFQALEQIIGKDYLCASTLGRPVGKEHLHLNKNFQSNGLPAAINTCYQKLLAILQAGGSLPNGSLTHNVDGFILGHPQLGSRIIEFDEEQHFTPARYYALKAMQMHFNAPYQTDYIALAKNLDYFNKKVRPKLRLKDHLSAFPKSYDDFIKWVIDTEPDKINGYIKENETFQYVGGRISQRAYYDSLRDVAHLMEPNKGKLNPAIRISQYQLEAEYGMEFNKIPAHALKKSIEYILNYYKL